MNNSHDILSKPLPSYSATKIPLAGASRTIDFLQSIHLADVVSHSYHRLRSHTKDPESQSHYHPSIVLLITDLGASGSFLIFRFLDHLKLLVHYWF